MPELQKLILLWETCLERGADLISETTLEAIRRTIAYLKKLDSILEAAND